jgi:hypothetical protein
VASNTLAEIRFRAGHKNSITEAYRVTTCGSQTNKAWCQLNSE